KKVVVYKTIKAKELWDLICTAAWQSAEPGLHFMERSNKRSNTYYFERLIATNPCGEQPLGAWAVCNLGAMNLAAYVTDEQFDFESFGKDVRVAMRMLDNVIDQTYYFFKENEECAKDIRRTGLGIMGLGDALIKMKLPYGSDKSIPVIEKIFKTLRDNAYDASAELAKEKGAFPHFDKDKYLNAHFVKNLPKAIRQKIAENGIRNAVLLTIAPTGTTSLVSGVSSGVEPVYEFTFRRKWRGGEEIMYHPLFDEWRKAHVGEERPDYFVSANDLTPVEHVKVQAVAQEYIDSSISKTVNAPSTHTVQDVKDLYMFAYDYGLKGITYMRDGSRMGVLERLPEKKDASASSAQEKPVVPVTPRVPRPMVLSGTTYKADSPIGRMYVTINHDENNQPFEVFINNGKSGSDVMAMADALGRMISFVLRLHSPVPQRERMREIVSELTGIGGARSVGFGENRVRSLPDAVAKVLARHANFRVNGKVEDKPVAPVAADALVEAAVEGNGKEVNGSSNGHVSNGQASFLHKVDQPESQGEQLGFAAAAVPVESLAANTTNLFDLCPECGAASFAYEEGCKKCYGCGYSEC
ncbi:MAG TPA: ribonucleoside-diphosphate reductase, adenosylcobalamin-dependent, partial [Patescibacteria group bacterium]|nr:ribonucleoside-diphosphate reductase, adenosylcobalamin-dependent [Patescibacteria group bacterium]